MKDLEIRGAGNLLGGEQSGHIADVGFDLYVRLVGEAVAEFRGDGAGGGAGGQDRAAGRRPPPARLRPERAAAAGDVQAAGRGPHPRGGRGGAGRARSTATATSRRRSTTCSRSPGSGVHARDAGLTDVNAAGQLRPLRARRPAGLGPAAARPALPEDAGQAGVAYDPGAEADDGTGRRLSRCATRRCSRGAMVWWSR